MMRRTAIMLVLVIGTLSLLQAQQSVARQWNEVLLTSIRTDIGRPTVHARNLFHISAAMYDAWAAYDDQAEPYLLGKEVHGFAVPFEGIDRPADPVELKAAREVAVSYAAYRLLLHRFRNSPGSATSRLACDGLMEALSLDTMFVSTDYSTGNPAALGNYIAQSYIDFGYQDGSNEQGGYGPGDFHYSPVNPALDPTVAGPQGLSDFNRWQPLSFSMGTQTPFLSPHWGDVDPFSLTEDDLTIYTRDGSDYYVYHDPGAPPFLNANAPVGIEDDYKWAFTVVAAWSAHLDPDEPTMIDISPASLGNIAKLPDTYEEMRAFYHLLEGGVADQGYPVNPVTGQPYAPQMVPRGDFGRVIAEFWADGPASETPPGHWFTILNYVSDHPLFEKRFHGEGPVLDDLEWDVKSYFVMGGAVHDVAVAVWGIKSWYDYIRPISAIRGMAALGQSTDSSMISYHPSGIPLIPGHIEVVLPGDPLAGQNDEDVGKIKIFAWRGPDWVVDPMTDYAGVDWILAENWWPYQRPSFVTPPFAGYVSGHSCFSRACAEVMTLLTGDEYFPGGLGEFDAPKNAFLVFEDGPSIDMTLQWAKYRDASDQASLSRIWGGIHPPVDDIPGRKIGIEIGPEVFHFAETYFDGSVSPVSDIPAVASATAFISPNPASDRALLHLEMERAGSIEIDLINMDGRSVMHLERKHLDAGAHDVPLTLGNRIAIPDGIYFCRVLCDGARHPLNLKIVVTHG